MNPRFPTAADRSDAGLAVRAVRVTFLILPVALLALVGLRGDEESARLLWIGAGVHLALTLFAVVVSRGCREPAGPMVILLYVLALAWPVMGGVKERDWVVHLVQAFLLVVPMVFFGLQSLRDSGASAMRRARVLAAKLAERKDWPVNLLECRHLPEVQALRESLHVDASPALELLASPRAALRVAALSALEFRPRWRAGQTQLVLNLARHGSEPEVRAAATLALANTDDRLLVESLAELMRDPSQLVRQTAVDAILWNTEDRWRWVRDAVRRAMADPEHESDGGLRLANHHLTPEVLNDLHAWTAEKGVVAVRAVLTLGVYYQAQLTAGASPELLARLRAALTDATTPTLLRLELAKLLARFGEVSRDDMRRLMEPSMPAPVRLIAIEDMLAGGECPEAVAALHDLARLPNREIALAVADVAQRRLHVDFGLPRNEPYPPVGSRAAADVARKVHHWASMQDMSETPHGRDRDDSPTPARRPAPSGSRVQL